MAMRTVVLDSSPSIPLHDPSNIPLNVSPPYTNHSKKRGQPLLGQRQVHYTHFIPMGEGSEHIKELLGIEETDDSEAEVIEGKKELLHEEKVVKGEEKSVSKDLPFDSGFEKEAKDFSDTPKNYEEDTFEDTDQSTAETTTKKNDAEIATVIAAAQPKKSPAKRSYKPRKKKTAKKPPKKMKKMRKFNIVRKKK